MAQNATLVARQKARERKVIVNGHAYTVRRPKAAEMLEDQRRIDLAKRFVVDWDLKQSDLIPGGNPEPEPFDAALFADWLDDDEDLWQPLSQAILDFWTEYRAAREADAKN